MSSRNLGIWGKSYNGESIVEQRQGAIDMMVLQYLLEDIGTNLDPNCRFCRTHLDHRWAWKTMPLII